jgi:hypothetical protein
VALEWVEANEAEQPIAGACFDARAVPKTAIRASNCQQRHELAQHDRFSLSGESDRGAVGARTHASGRSRHGSMGSRACNLAFSAAPEKGLAIRSIRSGTTGGIEFGKSADM